MPTALLLLALCLPAQKPAPKVYVVLWFDTEDYLLPASDDAALWVADFLTRRKIRGTFKVVGEKARVLAARKRDDVIAALKKHEIGYHSEYHSVHPTPAMYLSTLGWDEGVEEFDRREGKGWRDVERVFGQKPTCYGQPGSSWGPQSYGALARWGMFYLDAGRHVGLDGKPCYYGGVFNFYQLDHTIRADLNKPEELEKAYQRFSEARKQLLAEGGGVISIVYHPCEWVHQKFWDGVNFNKGANPPREKWVKPPQKTEAQTNVSKKVFTDYVTFMQRFKDVEFVTGSQVAKRYADRARAHKFTPADLRRVARAVSEGVTFQVHDGLTLSAAEVLTLLNGYVALKAAALKVAPLPLPFSPLGPTSRSVTMAEAVTTDASQFGRTAEDVAAYIGRHKRVPGTVWLGSTGVTPESYLRAAAKVALELLDGRPMPATITLQPTALTAAKHVSADDPKLWGWVIFPPGFRAPAMMDMAKRQAWSLKPALLQP